MLSSSRSTGVSMFVPYKAAKSALRAEEGCAACLCYNDSLPNAAGLLLAWATAARDGKGGAVSFFHCRDDAFAMAGVCFKEEGSPDLRTERTGTPLELVDALDPYLLRCMPGEGKQGEVAAEALERGSALRPQCVLFHATWCKHCKRLMPVWDVVSKRSDIADWAAVDVDAQPEVAQKYGVASFPTLLRIWRRRDGAPESESVARFEGDRTEEAILDFARSASSEAGTEGAPLPFPEGPSSPSTHPTVAVLFHHPRSAHCAAARKVWAEAAAGAEGDGEQGGAGRMGVEWRTVDASRSPALCAKEGIHSVPTGVVYTFDPLSADLPPRRAALPDSALRSISSLLSAVAPPLSSSALSPMDEVANFLASGKTVVVLFHAPWCGHCQRLMPHWKKAVASSSQEEGLAAVRWVAVNCDDHSQAATDAGVASYPTIQRYSPGRDVEQHTGERSSEALLSFARDGNSAPAVQV